MALFCDKYRPTTLAKLDYNLEQASYVKRMIQSNDFPHLLVYGTPGAGKKTRINCFLKEIFGNSVEKLKLDQKVFTNPSGRKIEINVISSNYHCEVNPNDVGVNDRIIVQGLIKEMALLGSVTEKHKFKVVIINEADKLTVDAQHGLRRTMEKYINNLRIILSCNSSSRMIPAIRSRCYLVRVAAPSIDKISEILLNVAKKESYNLNLDVAKKIAEQSDRNLRRALLMLETMKLSQCDKIVLPPWQLFIKKMADTLIRSQTVQTLSELRNDFYELQMHLIPPDVVFSTLVTELLPQLDNSLKIKVIDMAAHYEHLMKLGSKKIYYFEAFAANFMSLFKNQLKDFFDDDDSLLGV